MIGGIREGKSLDQIIPKLNAGYSGDANSKKTVELVEHLGIGQKKKVKM